MAKTNNNAICIPPFYDAQQLYGLAQSLSARYPGVRIVWAFMIKTDSLGYQQTVRYQAPLSVLEKSGLFTNEMLADTKRSATSDGDGFGLSDWDDEQSKPGCVDLTIHTAMAPREQPQLKLTDAKKLLRQFTGRRKAKAVRHE